MKICAIICEYNPFHNGHLYQLQQAKARSGADAVLCIMSGNFVQRGEAAILDKFTRARHAVLAGADAVIELPTIFATSPAELFAKGAISILQSIPAVDTLCFGAEYADATEIENAAAILNDEPKEISEKIKSALAEGVSYAKARAMAYEGVLSTDLLSSPNNILALEYTKAILSCHANIQILPILRQGSSYNDTALQENFSSASAIRQAIQNNLTYENNTPAFVANDLPTQLENKLDSLEKYALLAREKREIKKVCDCSEGLENALKKAAILQAPLAETLTSARYTSSRIQRIALQNLLHIDETLIRQCLNTPLYLRVLAIKKERSDLLSELGSSSSPLLIRAQDKNSLNELQNVCLSKDVFAEHVYSLLYSKNTERNVFV